MLSIPIFTLPTGDTHIPSDMSMGIHKPQGYPYHCDTGPAESSCVPDKLYL